MQFSESVRARSSKRDLRGVHHANGRPSFDKKLDFQRARRGICVVSTAQIVSAVLTAIFDHVLSEAAVCSTGAALAAHVLEHIQAPRSGLLEPAHTSSSSPTHRRFRPICDDMRFVRARSHITPLRHDERRCPRGTLREPARTKSSSSTTRADARGGLCSRPLAQTRHQLDIAIETLVFDRYVILCVSCETSHTNPLSDTASAGARERLRSSPLAQSPSRAGALEGLCSCRLERTRHPQ